MFTRILSDLRRKATWYGLPTGRKSLLRILFSDGTGVQITYRAMQFCQTHHLKIVAFLLYRLNILFGHAVIGRGATFFCNDYSQCLDEDTQV